MTNGDIEKIELALENIHSFVASEDGLNMRFDYFQSVQDDGKEDIVRWHFSGFGQITSLQGDAFRPEVRFTMRRYLQPTTRNGAQFFRDTIKFIKVLPVNGFKILFISDIAFNTPVTGNPYAEVTIDTGVG